MKLFEKLTTALVLTVLLSLPAYIASAQTSSPTEGGSSYEYSGGSYSYGGGSYGGHYHSYRCRHYCSKCYCRCKYSCKCSCCCGGNDVPLDGGLGFLAVAGAMYGAKRVRDNRKNKKREVSL